MVSPKRRRDGTIRSWPGGSVEKWSRTRVRLGVEFRKQNGRAADIGDIVRSKAADGSYKGSSEWAVKTQYGWRSCRTGTKKPTRGEVEWVLLSSKKGR